MKIAVYLTPSQARAIMSLPDALPGNLPMVNHMKLAQAAAAAQKSLESLDRRVYEATSLLARLDSEED